MEKTSDNTKLMLGIALNEVVRLRQDITRLEGELHREKGLNKQNRIARACARPERTERAKKETTRMIDIIITNDLSTLKGDELRFILEKKGLSTKGKNSELRERVREDIRDNIQ